MVIFDHMLSWSHRAVRCFFSAFELTVSTVVNDVTVPFQFKDGLSSVKHMGGLAQDSNNFIANALDLLQSCFKSSVLSVLF